MSTVHDFSARRVDGSEQPLSDFRGKVMLVVNTASECGFTPQYEQLQTMYERLKDRGFTVLAFPCNQFGGQEPGSDEEIGSFCNLRFRVRFPVFSKIEVNGPGTASLYRFLKDEAPGVLGTKRIKWNFTKFLVDANGKVVGRYGPMTKPEDIAPDIDKLLKPAAA